jgi:ribokinase
MAKAKVINIGSINIDNVYSVDHIVVPGETIAGTELKTFVGGKGANQSVAVAKAGVEVFHVGKVGEDGINTKEFLDFCGVNTDFVEVDPEVPTGHAVIQLDSESENSIILFQGANHCLEKSSIKKAIDKMNAGDIMILQNEVNDMPEWIRMGYEAGLRICFNPAPCDLSVREYPLHLLEWLVLNETEAAMLSEEDDNDRIIKKLLELYPDTKIILTLGSKGACLISKEQFIEQAAEKVRVVDTVAAGDTFIGYFVAGIIDELSEKDALARANRAAGICVGREGAAQAIPLLSEL